MPVPEGAVAREPRVDLCKSTGIERVNPALSVAADAHETGIAQRAQVLRNGWLRYRETTGEFPSRAFAAREHIDNLTSSWVGKCRERVHSSSVRYLLIFVNT